MDAVSLIVGLVVGASVTMLVTVLRRRWDPLQIQADHSVRLSDTRQRGNETLAWQTISAAAVARGLPAPPPPWQRPKRLLWGALGAALPVALYGLHIVRVLDIPAWLTGAP